MFSLASGQALIQMSKASRVTDWPDCGVAEMVTVCARREALLLPDDLLLGICGSVEVYSGLQHAVQYNRGAPLLRSNQAHPADAAARKIENRRVLERSRSHVGAGAGARRRGRNPAPLYLGSQMPLRTTNGGQSWEEISPDLTRAAYETPSSLGVFTSADPEKGKHRGDIYTIAPSYKDGNVVWVGTDDGLIRITRDAGKNWTNVTPPALTPWSKVSLMDASQFDAGSAYAAINRFRLDDLAPHIWRTHDFGKTWKEITRGLPDNAPINTVREQPPRRYRPRPRACIDSSGAYGTLRRMRCAMTIR
jgi:hypothetical protein